MLRAVLALLLILPGCAGGCSSWDSLPEAGGGLGGTEGNGTRTTRCDTGCGAETITDLYSRNFTDPTFALPTCTAGTGCELLCQASGTDWSCVDESGASVSVTQGTGAVAYSSPWGASLDDVTDARAPKLASSFDAVLAGAHTVVWMGHSSNTTFSYQYPVGIAAGAGDTVQLRQEGSSFKVVAGLYEATYAPMGPLYGWGMFSYTSNSANSSWKVRANEEVNTDTTGTWTDPTTTEWWFGRGIGGCASGCPLRGPMRAVAVFSTEKSNAELLELENAFYGIPTDAASPIVFTRTGTAYEVIGGRAVPFGPETPYVSARGIEFDRGTQGNTLNGNGWAADNLDASSWTAVGTPTTTTNAATGPFDAVRGFAAAADLIVDDAAGSLEGYQGSLQCGDSALAGYYTASCYIRSGTSGTTTTQATVGIITDGTGSADCTTTSLTSDYSRVECSANVGGSPTYVRGRVLVGDAAADTGSIIVGQCQCDASDFAAAPRVANEAVGYTDWAIPSTEDATWPSGETQGGEAEVVFTLDHEHPTQGDFYEYLIDAKADDGLDHWMSIFITFTDQVTPAKIRVALRPDSGTPVAGDQTDTDTYSDNLPTLEAGQPYVVRFRWMPLGEIGGYERVAHYIYFDECADLDTCRATTLIGSDTSGDKLAAIGAPGGGVSLGERLTDQLGLLHGAISRVRVSEVD